MKKSYPTATDMFCGCGGSSQGATTAGIDVRLAMNHWPLAIKSHNANFPNTDHDCADISGADPRRYDSTDILIASPECTNHSLAKGKGKVKKQLNIFEEQKAAEDRSRATMWDVPRFAEVHKYNIIVTENVVDAKRWIMYPAWLNAMELLGYNHRECFYNSMHFQPTPQSRDRMYVVFWRKGNKAPNLDLHPKAWCEKCEKNIESIQTWKPGCMSWGKYRTQYEYRCPCGTKVEPYYYAAMNCIDWSIPPERIGDKKRKVKPKTRERVAIGIEKFWNNPFIMYGGDQEQLDRTYSLGDAIPTQCAQPWHQIVSPFFAYSSQNHGTPRVSEGTKPLYTQTTTQDAGIIYPPLPFIIKGTYNGEIKTSIDALNTQTAQQSYDVVLPPPFSIEFFRTGTARSLTDAIGTQLGSKHNAIITHDAWQAFIGYYYGNAYESHISDPIGTCTTVDRSYLAMLPAGQKIEVDDCYYRMIRAKEVGRAMAFHPDYIVYGDERQQVRQFGNAVTPPAMEWLMQRCIESLN
jgi:DNA (cytosine-5)-methyltransferase 1